MCERGKCIIFGPSPAYILHFLVPFDVILPAVPNQIPLPPMIMHLDSTHVCTLVTDLPSIVSIVKGTRVEEELGRYDPVS